MSVLYYVIGPSGSGKDSVIGYARERLGTQEGVVFAHRYITRGASAGGENHVALSEAEFGCRLEAGLFCMSWQSHGLQYGIGVEVELWLERGCSVVVNGSRAYLPEAARRFEDLTPVLISVSGSTLRKRLEQRGRESESDIEERIRRAETVTVDHPRLVRLANDGPLEEAGEAFSDLVSSPLVAQRAG